ncbi:MAG TPA: serine/threonine-protein kinase, partial [Bacteroidia bacterium]|nr:serine/threonine-protein kinase [Bacteroidia bacterium]
GPIPTAQLRELFGQILDGFVYAHGKMVVHRDIKPSNFLVTRDGNIKILDFGIAKILTESNQKLTKTGANMGTVLYMSPEQVLGGPLDIRSDIYSLGVTLFQMATGQCPYDAESSEFLVYDQIVNKALPVASGIYPGVTADVEALISKATQKSAAQRFQDCTEFKRALMEGEKRQVVAPVNAELSKTEVEVQAVPPAQAIAAPPAPAAASATAPAKSGKSMMAILGIVFGLVAVVLVVGWQAGVFGGGKSVNEAAGAVTEVDGPATALSTVKDFYYLLGTQNYQAAYSLTKNPKWKTYDWFSSSNAFGCVNESKVRSINESKTDASTSKVTATAFMGDPCNGDGTYTLEYTVKKINGEWLIVNSKTMD